MTTPTGPFITPADSYTAMSSDPIAIGQFKINQVLSTVSIKDSDDDIRAKIEQVVALKETYGKWQVFYEDLRARKARIVGFRAVLLALDVEAAATAMGTTKAKVEGVMNANIAAEEARLVELQQLWDTGVLPDRPVLSDPSKDVIDPELTD